MSESTGEPGEDEPKLALAEEGTNDDAEEKHPSDLIIEELIAAYKEANPEVVVTAENIVDITKDVVATALKMSNEIAGLHKTNQELRNRITYLNGLAQGAVKHLAQGF